MHWSEKIDQQEQDFIDDEYSHSSPLTPNILEESKRNSLLDDSFNLPSSHNEQDEDMFKQERKEDQHSRISPHIDEDRYEENPFESEVTQELTNLGPHGKQ